MSSRWMDNSIGRYISPDQAQDGMNWYVYCNNNPTSLIDPTGLYDETSYLYDYYFGSNYFNYGGFSNNYDCGLSNYQFNYDYQSFHMDWGAYEQGYVNYNSNITNENQIENLHIKYDSNYLNSIKGNEYVKEKLKNNYLNKMQADIDLFTEKLKSYGMDEYIPSVSELKNVDLSIKEANGQLLSYNIDYTLNKAIDAGYYYIYGNNISYNDLNYNEKGPTLNNLYNEGSEYEYYQYFKQRVKEQLDTGAAVATNDEMLAIGIGQLGYSAAKGLFKAGIGAGFKKISEMGMKNFIPTYSELAAMKIPGFQSHHILPQYLGKMLGYTEKEMLNHPGTLVSQWYHTGGLNPSAIHKAISNYLPVMRNGQKAFYSQEEIYNGLRNAYNNLGRPDLFDAIEELIK